jgi:SNF family Na+-dependent transporter/acetylornithine deacetylase/succinyl-diaminopimelate desuccinylase-like protein
LSDLRSTRSWSSGLASHLAVVGAAVGLGSIWRFPYLAGAHGGGAFVAVFIFACFFIATPLLVAEFILGRTSRRPPPQAAGDFAAMQGRGRAWNAIGVLGTMAAFLINSYYTVIAGWVLRYLWLCGSGALVARTHEELSAIFRAVMRDGVGMGIWQLSFLGLAAVISAGGLQRGIEVANRIRAPAFLVLLLILVVYACAVGDVRRGLHFALWPDFSRLSATGVLAAIGQAFFATGVGTAMMIAYGAYIPHQISIVRSAALISGSIILVSLLATIIVFPLVFSYGLNPAQGPELVFEVLPAMFAEMPAGRLIGALFFLLLLVAALTPTVASLEPTVAWLEGTHFMRRAHASLVTVGAVWVVGFGSIASFNVWSTWYPLGWIARFRGMTLYSIIDFLTSDIMLPAGAVLTSILVGWLTVGPMRDRQVAATAPTVRRLLWALLRYLCPVAILAVMLAALIRAQPVQESNSSSTLGVAQDVLRELIEIDTTHAQGSTSAARAIAARLLTAGFDPRDVQVLAPPYKPSKGNVVVRLRGNGKARPVLYIGHLDVVEARREDWTFDPFRLTLIDGWMYGRGTIDMKGQDAAIIASLIRLKREAAMLDRDVIAALTADEEAGGDANGVDWLLKEHRDLIDADLVVNPDGGEAGMKRGRKLYVAVQTSEKVVFTLALEATDKGGHSSRPTADNPVYRLAAALTRFSQFQFPVHLNDTTRAYFARRADLEIGQVRSDMHAITLTPPDPAAVARLSTNVETNIMLRTTCTATMIEGGHAENALPQRARALLQCRLLPDESSEAVQREVERVLGDPKITVTVAREAQSAPESPLLPSIVARVEKVTRSIWPDVMVLPEMSPAGTDSRYTRNRGIPSYGIDGMFDDLDDSRAHGRDERIGVQAFENEVEFTFRLMRAIAGAR